MVLRDTLFNAVDRVVRDLRDTGVKAMFDDGARTLSRMRTSEDKDTSWVSYVVFHAFTLATGDYSDIERKIYEIFEIDHLLSPAYWQELDDLEGSVIWNISTKIDFVCDNLPRVLSLLRQDFVQDVKSGIDPLPEFLEGKSILTVILAE